MKLYVFPYDSIQKINSSRAMPFLKKRIGTKCIYAWPELYLTSKQLQSFNATKESKTSDAVVSNNPFIISAFKKEDVIICEAQKDKVVFKKGQPEFQTFGASYDFILGKLFGHDLLISKEATKYIQKVCEGRNSKKKIKSLRQAIVSLGESFEKRFIYQKLYELEEKKRFANQQQKSQ